MIRRARLLVVVSTLSAGAVALIGSTQTWLALTLNDSVAEPLLVPGASALPVLSPLSLAVLALGAATSIVGTVLRYVFAALSIAIAAVIGIMSAQVALAPPVSAVSATVTSATGLSGTEAIAGLISEIGITPWPIVTALSALVLGAAGVLTLVTGRRWSGGAGRRYTPGEQLDAQPASRPHDAIDSWDDLSRGDDPTA